MLASASDQRGPHVMLASASDQRMWGPYVMLASMLVSASLSEGRKKKGETKKQKFGVSWSNFKVSW